MERQRNLAWADLLRIAVRVARLAGSRPGAAPARARWPVSPTPRAAPRFALARAGGDRCWEGTPCPAQTRESRVLPYCGCARRCRAVTPEALCAAHPRLTTSG